MWQDARAQDPAQAAQIDVAYVGAGILTADEVRANMGLAPLASPSLRGAPATKQSRSHLKKNLRKDDDEDDEDSEDDEDDGTETSSGSSNYNPDEPRIPAGQPGGGQWTTAGNGTSTDSGSISADNIRQALVDRFNNPAPTPQGVQVAQLTPPFIGPMIDAIGATGEGSVGNVGLPPSVGAMPTILNNDGNPAQPQDGVKDTEQTTDDTAQQKPVDIIAPDGKLIGEPGNGPGVQVMPDGYKGKTGLEGAEELYNDLTKGQGGKDVTPPDHSGTLTQLPNGDFIGIRPVSNSGEPSFDTKISGNSVKFKFIK